MSERRPTFSICIPAYNRAKFLASLLDSIYAQSYRDFNIVICEDRSPEAAEIATTAHEYAARFPGTLSYYENEVNLGYDANIRRLVEKATGRYCFFMGNDDLMCADALENVADVLDRNQNVGLVLKSYAWFDEIPERVNQEVRYFEDERVFAAGKEAIVICFRRSGVISGYIVHRDAAYAAATTKFDGTLYYQMHLTASVLAEMNAVASPKVLVLCRNTEAPEFGNSDSEKGKYVPGGYTPQARLSMVKGALSIINSFQQRTGLKVSDDITRDYANYFYPYIKDQLRLPFLDFMRLCIAYAELGFYKYPMFYLYCVAGYLLGENGFDSVTKRIRGYLGRSPQFGMSRYTTAKPMSK
jgi:glycosyltransferase involved in cell wall biosynthesis